MLHLFIDVGGVIMVNNYPFFLNIKPSFHNEVNTTIHAKLQIDRVVLFNKLGWIAQDLT